MLGMAKRTAQEGKRSCFVVAPIGQDGSPERRSIEAVLEILQRVLDDKYSVVAAHQIPKPGSITGQIIKRLINDDLVICDLTGLNANVMYELGVRHADAKPVILITQDDPQNLPFDIGHERVIRWENSARGGQELEVELQRFLKNLEVHESDNPVYRVVRRSLVKKEIEPGTTQDLILRQLDDINDRLERISPSYGVPREDVLEYVLTIIGKGEDEVSQFAQDVEQHLYQRFRTYVRGVRPVHEPLSLPSGDAVLNLAVFLAVNTPQSVPEQIERLSGKLTGAKEVKMTLLGSIYRE